MIERYAARIAAASAAAGRRVTIGSEVLDRDLPLAKPGRVSANRHCRLVRASDRWIAINLAREDDLVLVPAWLGQSVGGDRWDAVEQRVPTRPAAALIAQARLLGMAVAAVGETRAAGVGVTAAGPQGVSGRRVLDLSSLWAGPLCGAVLAEAGFAVTKLESATRRDTVGQATPRLAERLNGRKASAVADFADRQALLRYLDASDVVISSARPRAFASLGIDPGRWIAAAPGRVWVAITGHGWFGGDGDRVGFGDDAAAAGGLVDWRDDGAPRFIGDALADPLTGLAAVAATLEAIGAGGGALIDASLARVAREVATAEGRACPIC